MDNAAKFEVTGHCEMPGRGAFVLGHLQIGSLRPGDHVQNSVNSIIKFRIFAVESLGGGGTHKCAIILCGSPSYGEIIRAFPVGASIFLAN